jgi:hypothetical protein
MNYKGGGFFGLGGGGGGGGLTQIDIGNTVFVDAVNGNNATALRGRLDKPAADIATAKSLAVSGDNIVIWNDLTSQTFLNDSAKNLNYYIYARNLSFSGSIIAITTSVTCNVFAENTIFNGLAVTADNVDARINFVFDTLNLTGTVQLQRGIFNITGNKISKTNSGNTFTLGYSSGTINFEVKEWISTSASQNYITCPANVFFKNCNIDILGEVELNNSGGAGGTINFENSIVKFNYIKIGLGGFTFTGALKFISSFIKNTNATKSAIEALSISGASLIFSGSSKIQSVGTYSISNPTGVNLNMKLIGRIDTNKDLLTTNITQAFTGGLFNVDTNLE